MRLLMLPVFLLVFQVQAEKPIAPESIDGVTTVTAEEAIELILSHPDLLVIDSRRVEEYAKQHIEGAISLPDDEMTAATLGQLASGLNRPLLFYCNGIHCLRSSQAAAKAIAWGYPQVYWFRGGWLEWMEKAMPVSR